MYSLNGICAWWRISSTTEQAKGGKTRKASADTALRVLIRNEENGEILWQFGGRAMFKDYNRKMSCCYTAVLRAK